MDSGLDFNALLDKYNPMPPVDSYSDVDSDEYESMDDSDMDSKFNPAGYDSDTMDSNLGCTPLPPSEPEERPIGFPPNFPTRLSIPRRWKI